MKQIGRHILRQPVRLRRVLDQLLKLMDHTVVMLQGAQGMGQCIWQPVRQAGGRHRGGVFADRFR